MDIDNQPIRIGQEERGIFREAIHFEHHTGHIVLILRNPDLLEQAIFDVVALAD